MPKPRITFDSGSGKVVTSDALPAIQQSAPPANPTEQVNKLVAGRSPSNHILQDLHDESRVSGQPLNADNAIDFLNRYSSASKIMTDLVAKDPTIYKPILDSMKLNTAFAPKAFDLTMRGLNLFPALESGIFAGLHNQLTGKGTIFEGVGRYLKKNLDWGDALQEVGVPSGPEIPIKASIPVPSFNELGLPSQLKNKLDFKKLSTAHDALSAGAALNLYDLKDFGPVVTPRGVAGLALNIALDPLTYTTFGSNQPLKQSLKEGKPAISFMNKVLLKDTELREGIKKIKAVNPAFFKSLDNFSASIFGNEAVRGLADMFITDKHPLWAKLKNSRRLALKNIDNATAKLTTLFDGWSDADKRYFFVKGWETQRKEAQDKATKKFLSKSVSKLDPLAKEAGFKDVFEAKRVIEETPERLLRSPLPAVSYTHLTLPTNREV